MTCLKCGRESDQTFCQTCRDGMEAYPVKQGTIILLPKGRDEALKRAAVKRPVAVSLEDQLASRNRVIRRLTVLLLSMLLLMAAMGYAMFRLVKVSGAKPLGQNYSAVTKPSEDEGKSPSEQGTEEDVSRETSPESENETVPRET